VKPRVLVTRLLRGAALVWLAAATACRDPVDPIVVHGDRIVISNASAASWRDVELTVNRYYRARFDTLAAGGRIDAPLRRFQGGFGRYFDVGRERVTRVRVTATSEAGVPVVLEWEGHSD
jgi:hypothetical protein